MRNRTKRGFTLIEVLVALGILMIAGLGTLQLVDVLSRSNGNVSAEVEAMALARDLRAELENIPLLRNTVTPFHPAWTVGSPVTTSPDPARIPTIGANVIGANGGRYRVQYTRVPWTPPAGQGPDRDNNGVPDLGGFDITITVDNVGAVSTAPTRRDVRLMRAVNLVFRKEIQESAGVAGGGVARW